LTPLQHHDATADYKVDFLLEPVTFLGEAAFILFDAVAVRLSLAAFQLCLLELLPDGDLLLKSSTSTFCSPSNRTRCAFVSAIAAAGCWSDGLMNEERTGAKDGGVSVFAALLADNSDGS
jgi:hypothetical protein